MRLLLVFLLYISTLGWTWGDSLASKNNEANRLYKDGKIDEAMSKWRDAQIENPDSDKLHYNIGNGLHEQKKYDDAFKEYEKSLDSKDSGLQQKAYYNMGNTHYKMGKLLEAIEDYKKCLDINPNDEDAKYNIEFIRKKIKENMKKENEQQNQSSQSKQDEKKDQGSTGAEKPEEDKKEQGKEDQAQQENQQQKAQEENKENQGDKKEGQEAKEQQGSSGEEKKDDMSKEDAVRLLDALKDDEKDVQKELQNQPKEGHYRVEKDW